MHPLKPVNRLRLCKILSRISTTVPEVCNLSYFQCILVVRNVEWFFYFLFYLFIDGVETWIEPHEVIITPPEEPRLSQASEGSEVPSETPSPEALSPSGKIRRSRGDNSKRRKGVYITQWPEPSENDRSKLAAQSSEEREDQSITWSDLSDCEGHTPRRSVHLK